MRRKIVKKIFSADRNWRVCIFRRDDGTYGFTEERVLEQNSIVPLWTPTNRNGESFCASEDIALVEAIGRIPWFGEMVSQFADIDGWPRRLPSGPPPNPLNGALVICYTPLDQRHRQTGSCSQIRNGAVAGPASGLAICQYPDESGYFLFGCDADWDVLSDTWHQTLEDAKHQAEFEYTGVSCTWQQND